MIRKTYLRKFRAFPKNLGGFNSKHLALLNNVQFWQLQNLIQRSQDDVEVFLLSLWKYSCCHCYNHCLYYSSKASHRIGVPSNGIE